MRSDVSARVLRIMHADGCDDTDWRSPDGCAGNNDDGGIRDGNVLGGHGTGFLVVSVRGLRSRVRGHVDCPDPSGRVLQRQGKTCRNKINPLACARGQRANEG